MKIGWALDMIGWAHAQPFPTLATPLFIPQYLQLVFQLGNSSCKSVVTIVINGTILDMEAGSGAKCTSYHFLVKFSKKLIM